MNHVLRNASRAALSRAGRTRVAGTGLGLNGATGFLNSAGFYMSQRFNSDSIPKSTDVPVELPVDMVPQVPLDVSVITNAVDNAAAAVVAATPPEAGFLAGKIMAGIDYIHTLADIPYWGAIVAVTLGIRLVLLPVALKTIQGSARMAVMRPELQKVQERMLSDPRGNEESVKMKYQQEMKALFVKHKCNPLRAILWPLFQFPVFISFFMALKEMGVYYPGFATGGTLWFENLSAADPTMVLPVLNALSFLAMIELGADGIQVQQQTTFRNAMRGLAVVMIPITMDMNAGLFVYWCTNNALSLVQTAVMKNEGVRKALDIPKPPAPEDTPPLKMHNPFKVVQEMLEKERAQKDSARAEILDGVVTAPAPPAAPKPTPASFAMPPRQTRRPKGSPASPSA